jgi:hypothetical protein
VQTFRIDQEVYEVTEDCTGLSRGIMRELCQRIRRQTRKRPANRYPLDLMGVTGTDYSASYAGAFEQPHRGSQESVPTPGWLR